MLCPFTTASRLTPIHQMSLAVLSRVACASMSTTTPTTTRDRGDRYGPMEWAQSYGKRCFLPILHYINDTYQCSRKMCGSSVPWLESRHSARPLWSDTTVLIALATYTQVVHKAVVIYKVRTGAQRLLLSLQANFYNIQRRHYNNKNSLCFTIAK